MADVSHELGSIRHIVGSPLSSKVAMFNKVADQHNATQLLNPFSNVRGTSPCRPTFSKDEYGKPLAGSLTEMRGQKANIHVCKEMLELCEIICQEGFTHPEDKDIKVIFFGDLFNIYNHINDKCVGLLLRARKHKLVDFEGEMLFQRRDDEVPILTTKPIAEIRKYIQNKTEEYRRSVSPAPRATSVILDNMRRAVSQTPSSSPFASKAGTPRSMSPQPNGSENVQIEPIQYLNKPEPTLRQAQSTPAINIIGIENKAENAQAVVSKPEKTEANNDKTEEIGKKSEDAAISNSKVTVFLTKAPIVETCVIVEENEETTEADKGDNTEHKEAKVEVSNEPNVNKPISDHNSTPAEDKKENEVKNEISDGNPSQENKEANIENSDISKNVETVEVKSNTVESNISQLKTDIKTEMVNNSEEQNKEVSVIENKTSENIIVTEPPKTQPSPSAETEKIIEDTTKPADIVNNETIKSPVETSPIEQQPLNDNPQ